MTANFSEGPLSASALNQAFANHVDCRGGDVMEGPLFMWDGDGSVLGPDGTDYLQAACRGWVREQFGLSPGPPEYLPITGGTLSSWLAIDSSDGPELDIVGRDTTGVSQPGLWFAQFDPTPENYTAWIAAANMVTNTGWEIDLGDRQNKFSVSRLGAGAVIIDTPLSIDYTSRTTSLNGPLTVTGLLTVADEWGNGSMYGGSSYFSFDACMITIQTTNQNDTPDNSSGSMNLLTGSASGSAGSGMVCVQAGTTESGYAGKVQLQGGWSTAGGGAGDIELLGGSSMATGGVGGCVWIRAGDGDVRNGYVSIQSETLIMAFKKTVAPTVDDIPMQQFAIWANASDNTTRLYYNHNGTLRSVELL